MLFRRGFAAQKNVKKNKISQVAGKLPEYCQPVDIPHVTLVYFGGASTGAEFTEEEAVNAGIADGDVDVLAGLHESLEAMDNTEVTVGCTSHSRRYTEVTVYDCPSVRRRVAYTPISWDVRW